MGLSLLAGVETSATRRFWEEGALRTLAANKRLLREIQSRIVKVDVHTPAGIYLGTESVVAVDARPIHDVLIRTIRGLYFHHYGERLGRRARCAVQRLDASRAAQDPRVVDFVTRLPLVSIANGALKYRHERPSDAPLTSFWLMQFYGTEMVMGHSIDRQDPWEPEGPPMATDRWTA